MIYAGPLLTGTVNVIVQAYYDKRLWAVSQGSQGFIPELSCQRVDESRSTSQIDRPRVQLRGKAKWILIVYGLLIPAGWILSVV